MNQEVVNSRIQVDMETAKELSSLMLHMEYGIIDQYKSAVEVLREALWKYFPAKETRRVLDLDRRFVHMFLSLSLSLCVCVCVCGVCMWEGEGQESAV